MRMLAAVAACMALLVVLAVAMLSTPEGRASAISVLSNVVDFFSSAR